MAKIIILNGPAGSGKDVISQMFAEQEGYEKTCFKEPMFKIASTTLGIDFDEFLALYEDREWKESPQEKLNGQSVRDLMIHISESFIKPFLGDSYFGQQAASYISRRPWLNRFIFSDGGFRSEIDYLAELGHDVILVHLYRDGHTFEGDSRSYVLTNSVRQIYTLSNNGTIEEAVDELGRILDRYIDTYEPRSDSDEDVPPTPRRASGRISRGGAGGSYQWPFPTGSTRVRTIIPSHEHVEDGSFDEQPVQLAESREELSRATRTTRRIRDSEDLTEQLARSESYGLSRLEAEVHASALESRASAGLTNGFESALSTGSSHFHITPTGEIRWPSFEEVRESMPDSLRNTTRISHDPFESVSQDIGAGSSSASFD